MEEARFRELLVADVALRRGVADLEAIAAACRRAVDPDACEEASVASALVREHGVDREAVAALRAEVEALTHRAGGSHRRALMGRGGLDPRLAARLPLDGGADLASGSAQDVASRYVDFLPLGEGGMGIVYWALDTRMQRQVAFKVVRPPGHGSGEDVTPPVPFDLDAPSDATPTHEAFRALSARFLREARITGRLEHPGIAPVYELGETSEGVPYYTMRLITGNRTLADAIDEVATGGLERRLDLLEPFLKVCDTLRYAHARGVVHRDLKPANVALGEYGEVVVLDWGLATTGAAREDAPPDEAVTPLADDGLRTIASSVGTPGYMAPEAAAGRLEEIDARSDVWSLGAILHEILVGRMPIPFSSADELSRRVQHEDVPDVRRSDPSIPAALAELTARMLSRRRADRPSGVDEVARAIRRWQAQRAIDREVEALLQEASTELATAADLKGDVLLRRLDRATAALRRVETLRPGQARADLERAAALRERGIRERERGARRQVLRRTAFVGLVVAAVAAVAVASLLEARRSEAVDARQDATLARERAEDVMAFMVGDLQQRLEPLGHLDVLTAVGERARAYYERLPLEEASLASLPNRTRLWLNLGDLHAARGDLSRAIDAYWRAQRVTDRWLGLRPDDPDAEFLASIAAVRQGRALFDQGHRKDAAALFERHAEVFARLAAAHPDEVLYADAVAANHVNQALSYLSRGRGEDALRMLDAAQALSVSAGEGGAAWRRHIEVDLQAALILGRMRRGEEGLARARAARDRARSLGARDGSDVRWIEAAAEAHLTLGFLEADMGNSMLASDWQRALAAWDAALPDARRLRRQDPLNMTWAALLATTQRRRGLALLQLKETDAALAGLREAAALLARLTEQDPSNASWRHQLATLCDRVAALTPDPDERIERRRLAVEQAEWLRARDPDDDGIHHLYVYARGRLGAALAGRDAEAAIAEYRASFEAAEPLMARHPANHELTVLQSWNAVGLAGLLTGPERRPERLRLHRRALAALERTQELLSEEPQLLWAAVRLHAGLAANLADGGEEDRLEAAAVYRRARASFESLEASPERSPEAVEQSQTVLRAAQERLAAAGIDVGGDE